MGQKSGDAKKLREYDINTHKKGFTAESVIDGILIQEYFQFNEIHQIIYHQNAVEIVNYNGAIRVFYNDKSVDTLTIYRTIINKMSIWMNSNRN